MDKYQAISNGFMLVGELAKKAGVTTRTLRHYDREGLLSPSQESDSGYRLYTDKDLAKLMQILMMKQIGFSLSEIKKKMSAMDTTAEVINIITEHTVNIRKKIEHLTESLNALETLKEEIMQVDSVDFNKFASILTSLQMKNERYWLIKYFDNDILTKFKELVSDKEDAAQLIEVTESLIKEAAQLHNSGIPPESSQGQEFAERLWKWVLELTSGDFAMAQKMNEQILKSATDKKYDEVMEKSLLFMYESLDAYFSKNSLFEEAAKLCENGIPPESDQAQALAESFWKWIMELTGGNMALIQQLNENFEKELANLDEITKKSHLFMSAALEIYFKKSGGKNG